MKIAGTHTLGLGRGEIRDDETGASLDVVSVTADERGVLVEIVTRWTVGLSCLDYLLVVNDADTGQVLGWKRVDVPPSGVFSLSPCEQRVTLRVNAPADSRVRVQMWQSQDNTVEDVQNGTAIGYAAESRPFYLDDAARNSEPQQDESGDPIQDTVASATSATVGAVLDPILTYGTLGLGLYVAWRNRNLISAAAGDLFGSATSSTPPETP